MLSRSSECMTTADSHDEKDSPSILHPTSLETDTRLPHIFDRTRTIFHQCLTRTVHLTPPAQMFVLGTDFHPARAQKREVVELGRTSFDSTVVREKANDVALQEMSK